MSNIYFNTLLKISLSHEYHADGLCNELEIKPTRSTLSLLNKYGILFKKTGSGATLLYESPDGSTTMKVPVEEELKFTFLFTVNNPAFYTFSDIEFGSEPLSTFYFNNLNPVINGQNHTILDSKLTSPIKLETRLLTVNKLDSTVKFFIIKNIKDEEFKYYFDIKSGESKVRLSDFLPGKYTIEQFDFSHNKVGTTYTYYYNDEIFSSNLLGVIELFIDSSFNPANPVTYLFNFKSRPTIWRYNILKKPATPSLTSDNITAATISVKHEPDNPADEIIFKPPTGTDPIVILSNNAVKMKEKGYDKIRLKRNTEILISNLPNSSAEKIENDGSNWLSDIYVYVYV